MNLGHAGLCTLCWCTLGVRDLSRQQGASAHRSLTSHQTQDTRWFLIFAGALLGITAALLWSAQGCIMMSYPLEKDKGKAFGVFWAIFQFGSFVGAIIALAINLKQGHLDAVATSTYIVSSPFGPVMKPRGLESVPFVCRLSW